MKVYIKNIGGLTGEHEFELVDGVNEVVAPNAAGKTTFVKALLALLNPKDPNVRPEDLLNLDADEGYVRLVVDGDEYYRAFKRESGRVIETSSRPLASDEVFSWLLLDPFMGRLVTKVLAGDEDVTDFIDAVFRLSELRGEIERLRGRIEELNVKRRELLEKSQDLARLMKEREETERKLQEKEREARAIEVEKVKVKEEVEKTIRELREQIASLSGRLESYRKELGETDERIKDLEAKIAQLEERVDEFRRKHPDPESEIKSIDKDIDDIRKTRGTHEERLAELNRANPVLLVAVSQRLPYCPVCGRPIENPESFWEARSKELGRAVEELKKSIDELNRKELELLDKKGRLEREWTEIRNIEGVELPSLRRRLELERDRKRKLEEEIGNIEAQIRVLEERVRELEARMPEEERRRVEELSRAASEVRALREYLDGINRRIEALGDVGRELEELQKELERAEQELRKREDELLARRRTAIDGFRRIASELARELGFAWFRSIALSEEGGRYVVRVVRALPSGREERQSLRQLSTSERVSIALVAVLLGLKQLADEGRYPRDRLIVLADEALLAFDPERYGKVRAELGRYGRYVVVTRLAEPSRVPALSIVHE